MRPHDGCLPTEARRIAANIAKLPEPLRKQETWRKAQWPICNALQILARPPQICRWTRTIRGDDLMPPLGWEKSGAEAENEKAAWGGGLLV